MKFNAYHKDLNSLHIGCEAPRAYFIPYQDEETALNGCRKKSAFYNDLCGEWNFRFYKSFEDIEDDFLDIAFDNTITVPKCWQADVGKGYDAPLYSNLFYAFPLDPPFVPDENPCGLYNRTFNVDKQKSKKYYINFEGVDSSFYLYINGKFKGYSQISHATSEFDITELAINGENTIDVLVLKWCISTYLECQDKFRFSGIFRNVYMLTRPEGHITDYKIETTFDKKNGILTFINESNTDIEVVFEKNNLFFVREHTECLVCAVC